MKSIFFLLFVMVSIFLFTPSSEAPTHTYTVQSKWSKADSEAYARDQLTAWQEEQWSCLSNLWGKESAWNPKAYNSVRVMGKNAGGIPQLLGLDPTTPAPLQIDRGLSYIYYRYGTPCEAWHFFKKNGWH
jgi:hypothetical protein